MFAWNDASWDEMKSETALPKLDIETVGVTAGTKVATSFGWVAIETVQAGQQVLTFDGGLQTVTGVTRRLLMVDAEDVASWPLVVPAGSLGNTEEMTILANQSVMIESDAAEQMTGDPFALIPATALAGVRGIAQSRPAEWVEVIELHFDQDEVVFANIGALFLCRAQADLLVDAPESNYEVLKMDVAKDLVNCLTFEDQDRAPSTVQTTPSA